MRTSDRSGAPARAVRLFTTTLVGASLATAAHAQLQPQTPLGSHIRAAPETVDPGHARLILKSFAQCVFTWSPDTVARILEHSDWELIDFNAAGIEVAKLPRLLKFETCLSREVPQDRNEIMVKLKHPKLRTVLLEEAYLARYKKPPSLPVGAVELMERRYVSTGEALATVQHLASFADCVTFQNTAGADAMLRAAPASPDERTAARALAPALGVCLEEGQKLALNPANIRALAADGLWSRYVGASTSTGSAAK